jgi:hypothetical protein
MSCHPQKSFNAIYKNQQNYRFIYFSTQCQGRAIGNPTSSIQEVSDSNLDPDTDYSEWSSLWVSRISPDKFRDSGLHQTTIASFHTIWNVLITDHFNIRRYIGCPRRKGQYSWRSQCRSFLAKRCTCTCVLFRTVSEIELFHCTVHSTLYRRATRHVLTRDAKCIDVDGGIFENVLY